MNLKTLFVLVIAFMVLACADTKKSETLFERLSTSYTGIDFQNSIETSDSINILNYEYLYNGGGVGVGDFNNDDLPDVIFTGNLKPSKIYKNNGSFKFDDITLTSGINTENKWCTGVSIVDINQDGYDDIYISVGGMGNKSEFPNLLYINNKDLTFTESAAAYGLADQGESIQALFFDYDRDGDLDMYLLTGGGFEHSAIQVRPMSTNGSSRNTDRLYKNNFDTDLKHPVFKNVSAEAGITFEGFGLGISVLDANNDNWPDLYISNDYLSRDYVYVNQQDGTFKEKGEAYFGHMSHFSMGNDVADLDNNGFTEVITVDMLPEDLKRRKLMSGANSYDLFQIALRYGYGHQYMRNMLQRNNGNGTFSEIGQFSGIDKTDWSWAPLIADFDNDGLNDLFISNGFGKDITDMDFVKFRENQGSSFGGGATLQKAVKDCLVNRPAIKVANYSFKNQGNLKFKKSTKEWGFEDASVSSGAVYADFDNDGDLDLMVSNIDAPAFVYKNRLRDSLSAQTNYLKINFKGTPKNPHGIGAAVKIYTPGGQKLRINQPVRGFQSSVSTTLHFGLNDATIIDSMIINWPDGKQSVKRAVAANQQITVSYNDESYQPVSAESKPLYFRKDSTIQFTHKDRFYNDYATQPLLMHNFSNQGPALAAGDLNGDGLEDLFVGGSYGEASSILYQNEQGSFETVALPETALYEDTAALIFDANNDGRQDLYITSGGSERYVDHKAYQDRFYLNTVNGLELQVLPELLSSTATVAAGDFDKDGDLDLFVGGRVVPGKFPSAPQSFLLKNTNGKFEDITATYGAILQHIGMVTSAVFTDFNADGKQDLVLVGEFMPITFLENSGEKFVDKTTDFGLQNTTGLWNSLLATDIDKDGDLDFIAGNMGQNTVLHSKDNKPLKVAYADFDNNGYLDPIFSKYEEGAYFPLASLDQLSQQLPMLKKKLLYYNSFAKASTQDLLDLLKTPAKSLEAAELRSVLIENTGNIKFNLKPLPQEVQLAPINAMLTTDLNNDGFVDLLLVGNNYGTEVNGGRYDASFGISLVNDQMGGFEVLPNKESGFLVKGDSKSIVKVSKGSSDMVVVGRNGESLATFIFLDTNTHNLNTK